MDPNDTEIVATIVFKKGIDMAVAKIRKIVQKISKSLAKPDFLKAKCVKSGAKFTTLISDYRTRWNSLADMLDCTLNCKMSSKRCLKKISILTNVN